MKIKRYSIWYRITKPIPPGASPCPNAVTLASPLVFTGDSKAQGEHYLHFVPLSEFVRNEVQGKRTAGELTIFTIARAFKAGYGVVWVPSRERILRQKLVYSAALAHFDLTETELDLDA